MASRRNGNAKKYFRDLGDHFIGTVTEVSRDGSQKTADKAGKNDRRRAH